MDANKQLSNWIIERVKEYSDISIEEYLNRNIFSITFNIKMKNNFEYGKDYNRCVDEIYSGINKLVFGKNCYRKKRYFPIAIFNLDFLGSKGGYDNFNTIKNIQHTHFHSVIMLKKDFSKEYRKILKSWKLKSIETRSYIITDVHVSPFEGKPCILENLLSYNSKASENLNVNNSLKSECTWYCGSA